MYGWTIEGVGVNRNTTGKHIFLRKYILIIVHNSVMM